jgi:hypothetical protein
VLAPLSVPWIAAEWGWQAAFIAIGAIGFLWMGVWQLSYEKPEQQKRLSGAELAYINSDTAPTASTWGEQVGAPPQATLTWMQLLTYRQTWAFAFGKFMTDGIWWFFLFWLPKYLSAQYGMGKTAIMVPLAVLYSMTMVGSIGGGWLPTWFINRGASAYDGRMKAMLLIAMFPLVVLLAQPFGALQAPFLGNGNDAPVQEFYFLLPGFDVQGWHAYQQHTHCQNGHHNRGFFRPLVSAPKNVALSTAFVGSLFQQTRSTAAG